MIKKYDKLGKMPMLDSRIHNEQLTEKLPLATDGNKYEEPQLDII